MQAARFLTGAAVLAMTFGLIGLPAGEKEKQPAKAGQDAEFVMKASQSDIAEIALGKLATKNAAGSAVRKFAQHMVEDHSKSSEELKALAGKGNVPLAKGASEKHQAKIDKLSKLQGAEFDRMYMEGQVKAHMEAVKLFRAQAESGQDAGLKAFAAKTLPIIEKHLKMAQEIAAKTGTAK